MSVQDPFSATDGELPAVDPLFEAFHRDHQEVWVRYAHLYTGSAAEAEKIADTVAMRLEANWKYGHPNVGAAGVSWKLLKDAVKRWTDANGGRPAIVETCAFEHVMERSRDRIDSFEESLGLYSAIYRLSGRQFETIILHCVLGYPFERITQLLGVTQATVRSHLRFAKKRLEEDLIGLRLLKIEA